MAFLSVLLQYICADSLHEFQFSREGMLSINVLNVCSMEGFSRCGHDLRPSCSLSDQVAPSTANISPTHRETIQNVRIRYSVQSEFFRSLRTVVGCGSCCLLALTLRDILGLERAGPIGSDDL